MSRPVTPPEKESLAQQFVLPAEAVQEDFHRGLKERHIQMIAIGGAIGVGLFLGSAKAIQQAGPSLLLAYAVAGVAIFLIMRALGELLLYRQSRARLPLTPMSSSVRGRGSQLLGRTG